MQWIGVALIACAAAGISGVALAGHEAAARAADALAAPVHDADRVYALDMHVSIDGKGVDLPKFSSPAGKIAKIKWAENGKTIGFEFRVEPQSDPAKVKIVGNVLAGQDQHVISSPQLVGILGHTSTIEATDKSGPPVYRIDVLVNVAATAMRPLPPRADHKMQSANTSGPTAHTEQRNIEGRREITMQPPPSNNIDRGVTVETYGAIEVPMPPPPLPPRPMAMPAPPPSLAPLPPLPPSPPNVEAPPAPPAPPTPLAMRTPPSLPPLAPLPPTPEAMPPPPPLPPEGLRAPPPSPPSGKGIAYGVVHLRVLVGSDGRAKEVKIVRSDSGAAMFEAQAVKTVKQLHFNPAMKGGKPVEGWVNVPINFNPPEGE